MKKFKGSLFERLNSDFNNELYETNEEAVYASVANNLSHLFSTNAGSCEIALHYGRPDLNNLNLSMKESIERIEIFCENSVQIFEPRLINAKVIVLQDSLSLNQMNILIEGYLLISKKGKKVNFKADLLKNGKVKINKNGI